VTQELRLTSPQDQKISWILGGYYYDLTAYNRSRSARFDFPAHRVNDPVYPAPANHRQYSLSSWDQDSESKAIFGNTRIRFTDDFSLILGLRQTWESKDITISSLTYNATHFNYESEGGWFLPGGIIFTPSGLNRQATVRSKKNDWSEFTWDITPEYRFNDDLLGYVRIAKGFRSGGFNSSLNNGQIYETDPEILIDYELGLKSTLLDGQLTLNTAVFHYDIENLALNIQRAFYNTTTETWTTSALGQSDGKVTGIELEVDALITSNWRANGSVGYLKSEYTNFLYNIGGAGPFDASGNSFYRTPEVSVRLGTDYTVQLSPGNLILSTDWSYRCRIYHNATVQHDPRQETPGYWIGNVRLRYTPHSGNWEVAAYANNVLDEVSVYLRMIPNPNSGTQSTNFSQPRTYGLSATWRY
jgi:iron complex outermembrane receptor protein